MLFQTRNKTELEEARYTIESLQFELAYFKQKVNELSGNVPHLNPKNPHFWGSDPYPCNDESCTCSEL